MNDGLKDGKAKSREYGGLTSESRVDLDRCLDGARQSGACAISAALLVGMLLVPVGAQAKSACEALQDVRLGDVTITKAVEQPAGILTLEDNRKIEALPGFCRVVGRIKPGADSDIGFEMWIPPSDGWNGKALVVGTGGYEGVIRYDELAPGLRRGYATISVDSGHEDKAGYRNETLDWGVGHPDKIADWAYRSIHAAAVTSRAIIQAFAQREPAHNYYFGCSTGGGQGMAAVQRYPEDFDGVIAGAPGNNRSALNLGFLWMAAQNLQTPAGYIPPAKLPAITRAAVASCDAKDGLVDGLISSPEKCNFDPSVLQCDGKETDACLTSPQVDTLKRLYAGARNPRTGEQIYPGWPVGSESSYLGGWAYATKGPEPFRAQFFRDWVFKDAKWDWRSFDWDRDVTTTRERIGPLVDSVDPDLSAFKKRGGKLIVYQGLADPIVSAYDTVNHFAAISRTTGDTQDFARLFLAPGMGHCRGGDGLNALDVITALETWVEHGTAPDRILASAQGPGSALGGLATAAQVSEGTPRTRPLCAYPKQAKYTGKGSIEDAKHFVCVAGD